MSDLISRQAAIDAVCKYCEYYYNENVIQELKDLPSAEPDVPDMNVGDIISRQDAINAIYHHFPEMTMEDASMVLHEVQSAQPEPCEDEWCMDCKEYDKERHCCPRWNRVIKQTLKDAQPEIIRCKDCKWKQGAECVRFAEIRVFPDDFCSRAERKEN